MKLPNHPLMSTDYPDVNGLTPYEFFFQDRATSKTYRWVRYGANMEKSLEAAKGAALYEYPKAGGFLIRKLNA